MKIRRLIRPLGAVIVIALALGAVRWWQLRPSEWTVAELPGGDGVAISVEARPGGPAGVRLTVSCNAGRIGVDMAPIFVQCIGDCGSGGLTMQLSQISEIFIVDPRENTGWQAPWTIDQRTAKAVREFSDTTEIRAPPGDPINFPLDAEAFVARLQAARALWVSIDHGGYMEFDTTRLTEVMPRFRAACPAA